MPVRGKPFETSRVYGVAVRDDDFRSVVRWCSSPNNLAILMSYCSWAAEWNETTALAPLGEWTDVSSIELESQSAALEARSASLRRKYERKLESKRAALLRRHEEEIAKMRGSGRYSATSIRVALRRGPGIPSVVAPPVFERIEFLGKVANSLSAMEQKRRKRRLPGASLIQYVGTAEEPVPPPNYTALFLNYSFGARRGVAARVEFIKACVKLAWRSRNEEADNPRVVELASLAQQIPSAIEYRDHSFVMSGRVRFALFRDLQRFKESVLFDDRWWKLSSVEQTYTDEEVVLLLRDEIDKTRRKFERLRRRLDGGTEKPERRGLSDEVKVYVWRRDEGKCVQCGSNRDLEYDHIIPVAKGGSNTARNIQLLCETCNRAKSDRLA